MHSLQLKGGKKRKKDGSYVKPSHCLQLNLVHNVKETERNDNEIIAKTCSIAVHAKAVQHLLQLLLFWGVGGEGFHGVTLGPNE